MSKAIVIAAYPACGKSSFYNEWSIHSPNSNWKKSLIKLVSDDNTLGSLKSLLYAHENELSHDQICEKYTILDSDSSNFSWIKDINGNNTKERNPDFPNNYIQHIKDAMERYSIIFVSTHKSVREALKKEGIDYFLIYPDVSLKEEWKRRFIERGNNESFITLQMNNWKQWIHDMDEEIFPTRIQINDSKTHMSDIIFDLIHWKNA